MVGYEIVDLRVLNFFWVNEDDKRFVCKFGVSMEDLYKFIKVIDVCFNLRFILWGEIFSLLFRVMFCGIFVIVSDIDSFLELFSDVLLKVF